MGIELLKKCLNAIRPLYPTFQIADSAWVTTDTSRSALLYSNEFSGRMRPCKWNKIIPGTWMGFEEHFDFM